MPFCGHAGWAQGTPLWWQDLKRADCSPSGPQPGEGGVDGAVERITGIVKWVTILPHPRCWVLWHPTPTNPAIWHPLLVWCFLISLPSIQGGSPSLADGCLFYRCRLEEMESLCWCGFWLTASPRESDMGPSKGTGATGVSRDPGLRHPVMSRCTRPCSPQLGNGGISQKKELGGCPRGASWERKCWERFSVTRMLTSAGEGRVDPSRTNSWGRDFPLYDLMPQTSSTGLQFWRFEGTVPGVMGARTWWQLSQGTSKASCAQTGQPRNGALLSGGGQGSPKEEKAFEGGTHQQSRILTWRVACWKSRVDRGHCTSLSSCVQVTRRCAPTSVYLWCKLKE